jgi:hypothetical protein
MPLPGSVATVTLGGTVEHPTTGQLATGTATFELPAALATSEGYVLGDEVPASYAIANGAFVNQPVLPANDSPGLVPQGWTYRITVATDVWAAVFYASLPSSPTTTTLAALYAQHATAPVAGTSYVPLSALGAANGVATLGSDGILTASQRPAAGSGSVTSVTAADATIVIGGTPTVAPTARVGAIPQSQVTNLATDLATLTSGVSAAARKPIIRKARITSDTVTTPDTGGAWQVLQQHLGGPFEIDIPAAVGDWVEIDYNDMMRLNNSSSYFDVGVVVGSLIVRFLANDTNIGAVEGDPATYPQPSNFLGHPGARGFDVTPGDLDGGNVRFCLVVKSTGGNLLFAEDDYQFYWHAKNLGPHL